jgi:hypothetical protein
MAGAVKWLQQTAELSTKSRATSIDVDLVLPAFTRDGCFFYR